MKKIKPRVLVVCLFALVAGAAAGLAQAQTEVHPKSPAQALECLVKPTRAPSFPERHRLDDGTGAMRVLLKFKQADAAPEIELLYNTARQDMQDQVRRYLDGYRLPCLRAEDGEVRAVQEFHFNNSDQQAKPLPPERSGDAPPFCVVAPREDIGAESERGRFEPEHVIVVASFTGDGQQRPEVKFIYSNATSGFEKALRKHLAKYRMPCRKGGEKVQEFQQQFTLFQEGATQYGLARSVYSLREFLGLTEEPTKLIAQYDFKTMGCPFDVKYTFYGGKLPNEAVALGPADPNKLPFLSWLASLNLSFKNKHQANDLFGSDLQIAVPCGSLRLGVKAPAASDPEG
jgi:hypothetical protein